MQSRTHIAAVLTFVSSCAFSSVASAQDGVIPLVAAYEVRITKALSGGNSIDRAVTGQFYRDSRGRTRLEVDGRISISDPVARVAVFLDPSAHLAKRVVLPQPSTQPRVNPAFPASNPPREIAGRLIEGFETVGKEYTLTIPEGKMGNKAPIVQTIRTWYSANLKMPLLTVSSDEISGERSQSFRALQVGREPDASLFRIPTDYTVQDVTIPAKPATLPGTSALR